MAVQREKGRNSYLELFCWMARPGPACRKRFCFQSSMSLAAVATIEMDALSSVVQLYKALGGWHAADDTWDGLLYHCINR